MRRKRGISFGTMLMICLSVAVLIGSAWVLGRMGGSEWTQFDAGELISAMHGSLAATDAPVNTPVPQATIKTTTVTLAPAMPDGEKTATQAPAYHSFTMTLGGQLAFQSDVSDSVFDVNSKQFDYVSVVQEIATQVYADLNICTLPHLIIENGGQYADVSTDSQVLEAIKYLGVDRVLMNHGNVLDKGEEGLDATLHKLQEYGIGYAGVRNTDVDGNMAFYTVNDVNTELVFVNHGDPDAADSFVACLNDELGYKAFAPYSGTSYDLLAGDFVTVTEGKPIEKKAASHTRQTSPSFTSLILAAEKLLKLSRSLEGRANKELNRYTEQINKIIEKMEE